MTEKLGIEEIKEKTKKALDSDIALNIKKLAVFLIRLSETKVDDNIIENSAEISEIIADAFKEIATMQVDEKEAKQSAVNLLKFIAEQTKTPIDDVVVKTLDLFI